MGNSKVFFCGMILLGFSIKAFATPPDYKSFKREQKTSVQIQTQDLMRIWMLHIGQGDGIFIQFPTKYNYGPNKEERVELLVDGGPPSSGPKSLPSLISALYPEAEVTIEHAVITHHDQDHIAGIGDVLESPLIGIENIYHNGLASYLPTPFLERRSCSKYVKKGSARIMGCLEKKGDYEVLQQVDLIDSLEDLSASYRKKQLQGVYYAFARAVFEEQLGPVSLNTFSKAGAGLPFVLEREAQRTSGRKLDGLGFDVLWPTTNLRRYGSSGKMWGETINGNSVTFRMSYGDFQMLFTGDHNQHSQKALIEHLEEDNKTKLLTSDIIKVPHHGSRHGDEEFFRHEDLNTVLAVASQGKKGAKPKTQRNRSAWQHPSTEVIKWLGGHHRVYLTQMHEKRFRWADLVKRSELNKMYEESHILIETDGKWFRVVEVPTSANDWMFPPDVSDVRRSNGTRWIKAK